jgi:uncharacterized protein (DUF433 family)
MEFQYIVSDPEILSGKPIIKGSRISVQLILEWLASGASIKDIVEEFPHLPYEGVQEAVLYASRWMENEIFVKTSI